MDVVVYIVASTKLGINRINTCGIASASGLRPNALQKKMLSEEGVCVVWSTPIKAAAA